MISDVISLPFCPQVVSQASQHLSSEMQDICNGFFAGQSLCSVSKSCVANEETVTMTAM